MKNKPRKNLGGRPRKREPEAGEKVHLGIRVTLEMKRRLEDLATYNGRSQSQEAELRLERSFARDDLLVDALYLRYSKEAAGIVLAVGEIMNAAGIGHMYRVPDAEKAEQDPFDIVERRWAANPAALDVGLIAGIVLLAMLRPQKGEKSVTESDRRRAIAAAQGFLRGLVMKHKKDAPFFIRRRRDIIFSLFGPDILEQIVRRSARDFQDLEQTFHELAALSGDSDAITSVARRTLAEKGDKP